MNANCYIIPRSAAKAPIVAIARETEQQQRNGEVLEHYLNEYLTVPVTGMEVSDLAQRWLLTPLTMGRMVTAGNGGHHTEKQSFAACRRAVLHGPSHSSHSTLPQSVNTSTISNTGGRNEGDLHTLTR